MIHSISFSNFWSFRDKAYIDFSVNKKDSTDDTSVILGSGERISKIMTVVWPNASWKTNLLRVLSFLKFFLVDSWQLPPEMPLVQFIQPFAITDDKETEISISCIFEIDSLYEINVIFKNGIAISEILREKSKSSERSTWKTIFNKLKDNKGYRTNASIFFTLERNGDKLSKDILNFWRNINSNIPLTFQPISFDQWINPSLMIPYYLQNPNSLNRLNDLVKDFDFWFNRIDINQIGSDQYKIQVVHKVNWKEYDVWNLSKGTIGIINTSPLIFSTLDNGWVLVFDELDGSLHPEVVEAIVDLFASKKYNTKNAQIFFSTHNPRILNKLYKYQIQLVEKDTEWVSHTWRLDDIDWVRSEDNYYAKYMAWAYWARPSINI
jgi:AAA15 family ATPase/GTPase